MDNYDDEIDNLAFLGTGAKDFASAVDDEVDMEELDDLMIKPTDALLLAACSEEDFSHLDIYLYEEDCDNLYMHHDIILGTYPLCVEWLDFDSKSAEEKGSFVAIGTFGPEIEIWDLDVIDSVQPAVVLGGFVKNSKGKKTKKVMEGSHSDSVLTLSWNKNHRNVLASGSADKTIKLWDMAQGKALLTLQHHTDKVQNVQWNPIESSVLLSGSFDQTVQALDVRAADKIATWNLGSDIETLSWNPHAPNTFLASTENGTVSFHDALKPGSTLFTLGAHSKAVSSLSFNPAVPNLVVTGSTDRSIKFWDISDNKPNCLFSHTFGDLGKIFSVSFFKDSPHLLAIGGENQEIKIVNTLKFDKIRETYATLADSVKSNK